MEPTSVCLAPLPSLRSSGPSGEIALLRQEETERPWCPAVPFRTPREPGSLGFSSQPYLDLVNGFLIFFLPGFEEGLGIFNHLLQTVFWLLEWKGKVGEAEGRDGWDRVSHRARPGRERERQRMRLKEAGETEDEDWGQGRGGSR